MNEHKVSFRYARALLDTAKKTEKTDEVLQDLENLRFVFNQSKELASMTASPVFQLNKKRKIYQELGQNLNLNEITNDFIQLLLSKRRGDLIPSIVNEYIVQYNLLNNRLPVTITSAIDLDEDVKKQIESRLAEWTGKTLLPEYMIDDSIKGGMLVRIDDWVFDATMLNQLKKLKRRLVEGQ